MSASEGIQYCSCAAAKTLALSDASRSNPLVSQTELFHSSHFAKKKQVNTGPPGDNNEASVGSLALSHRMESILNKYLAAVKKGQHFGLTVVQWREVVIHC